MKSFFNFISWVVFFIGIYGILWPLPLFLLSQKNAEMYLNLIWQLPQNDKSAGAALPFFWMFFTAPIGILFIACAFGIDLIVKWFTSK